MVEKCLFMLRLETWFWHWNESRGWGFWHWNESGGWGFWQLNMSCQISWFVNERLLGLYIQQVHQIIMNGEHSHEHNAHAIVHAQLPQWKLVIWIDNNSARSGKTIYVTCSIIYHECLISQKLTYSFYATMLNVLRQCWPPVLYLLVCTVQSFRPTLMLLLPFYIHNVLHTT